MFATRRRACAEPRVTEAHVRVTQPLTGDAIDRAGVEVVHGVLAVAVEGPGADRGHRLGESAEDLGHSIVERCAPQGVPATTSELEMGMDEPFGDRARRQFERREHDPGRPTELDVVSPLAIEHEELGKRDVACGRALREWRELAERR